MLVGKFDFDQSLTALFNFPIRWNPPLYGCSTWQNSRRLSESVNELLWSLMSKSSMFKDRYCQCNFIQWQKSVSSCALEINLRSRYCCHNALSIIQGVPLSFDHQNDAAETLPRFYSSDLCNSRWFSLKCYCAFYGQRSITIRSLLCCYWY